MILADKIIEERKKNGWSQEELADKLGVSRQSVSKWEGAQSTPDLEKILKMSSIFEVSTDYLLKDEIENTEYVETVQDNDNKVHKVSMEEANEFLEVNKKLSVQYAAATLLCVLSPVFLFMFGGIASDGYLDEDTSGALGMIIMFAFIAAAVVIFIIGGKKEEKFNYLSTQQIETAYGVSGMVKERRKKNEQAHTRDTVIGTVICIAGAALLFLIPAICGDSDFLAAGVFGIMLAVESIGAFFLTKAEIRRSGYDKLLQTGDYTTEKKKDKVNGTVSFIYWMIAVAVFLSWTFAVDSWKHSWIVFAVAGVLYPAMLGVVKLIRKK